MAGKKRRSHLSRKQASKRSLKKSKSDHRGRSRSKLSKKRAISDTSMRSSKWSIGKRGKRKKKAERDSSISRKSSRWSFGKKRGKKKKNASESTTTASGLTTETSFTSPSASGSTITKSEISAKSSRHWTSPHCPKTSSDCLYPTAPEKISKADMIYMMVGLKLIAVVLTMLGGVILAVMINSTVTFGKKRSMRMAVPDSIFVYPGERVAYEPIEYSVISNLEMGKTYRWWRCLDDGQYDRKSLKRARVELNPCLSGYFFIPQYFHYSRNNKTISKLKEIDNPNDRMCLEVSNLDNHSTMALALYLDDCLPGKKTQQWLVFSNFHILNLYYNACIAAPIKDFSGPVIVLPCGKGPAFNWKLTRAPIRPTAI